MGGVDKGDEMFIIKWLKKLFTTREYVYLGSNKKFKELYKELDETLNMDEYDILDVLRKLDLLGVYMETQGDGRLVTELQARIKIREKL